MSPVPSSERAAANGSSCPIPRLISTLVFILRRDVLAEDETSSIESIA
jgi:hypothetical protein